MVALHHLRTPMIERVPSRPRLEQQSSLRRPRTTTTASGTAHPQTGANAGLGGHIFLTGDASAGCISSARDQA